MIRDLIEQKQKIDNQIHEEQRFLAIRAWEKAKQDAREAKAEVRRLKHVFLEVEAEWLAYERKCGQVMAEIETSHLAKPQYDDLPTDEEVKDWEDNHNKLVQKLNSMCSHRNDLAANKEHARMEMLKADQHYIQLGYAERNARMKAVEETGVSRVAI